MARLLHDFMCTNEQDAHFFEYLTDLDKNPNPPCPVCGELANRVVISAPRLKLDPCSGDFPGATMAWERRRAEKLKQERKQNS